MMVGGVCVRRGKYASALTPPHTVDNLDQVMERFARGDFDLLNVGRALVNDPCWLDRVSKGEELQPSDPQSMRG